MSSSPLLRARTRALLSFSFCLGVVALASWWTTSQRAKHQFNHATAASVSTGLFLPDKGVITPEATITVNSLSDGANSNDGLCTLREAITAANGDSASGFPAGECTAGSSSGSDIINLTGLSGTINLNAALPNIITDMTINGPGSALLTIRRDTGGDYRIFFLNNRNVNISGLTVTNGKTPDGAAGNPGGSATDGGGILAAGGVVTLTDLVITGNRTGAGGTGTGGSAGGDGGYGGGLWASGTLTMTNCVISNNTTGNGGSGGSGRLGGSGGGVYIGPSPATLTNVIIDGNRTGDGGVGVGSGYTGSNSGSGGGIRSVSTLADLRSVTISNNTIGNTSGADGGFGGGLMVSSGQLILRNSTVRNNATGNTLVAPGRSGPGGGIANAGTLNVLNSTINNNATGNSDPSSGSATGGGIWSQSVVNITNTTISGNTLGTGNSNSQGGGVYVDGNTTITNCTVTGNTSFSGNGAGLGGSNQVSVRNTIIAANPGNFDVAGTVNSVGHNLIGKSDGTNGFTNGAKDDQVGTAGSPLNPQIGLLADNGGATKTHALMSNSPALDAGDNCVTEVAHCGNSNFPQLTTDQRGTGFARLADGPDVDTTATVDIGAYEAPLSLANLPDAGTNEDTQLLVGFDPGDPSTITSITATSSNTTLVPNDAAHLSATITGSTGVVTINPAANLSGTTNITVTVNRTGGNENKTFMLTVVPINEAPSFIKGADQTVNEDAGAQTVNNWALAISPGPGDESGQTVTFQVTSNSNAALFSTAPGISPIGILTYTPAANANGSATIAINLKDDSGTANGGVDTSASQTFTITVNAVNDAPSFTKGPDQTVNNNAGPQTVNNWATNISRGPADEASQIPIFQVTGNTNPGLFSSQPAINTVGNLTYQFLANAGGTATITVVLKDTGGTANGGVDTSAPQTFAININPIGGFINFSAANYDTTENSGFVTVTVKRTGTLTQPVTVDYASSADNGLPCSTPNGVATPKCDFTTAQGTISFAAGEDTKTVDILISQDVFVEGPETLSVTLSNHTGGSTLTTPSTATATIADDVTEPPTNPIDDARNFVRQHYHDFLNREPDASGWDFWTNQITSCGSDSQCVEVRRIDVSASFFLSIEFQQSGYLVERFYRVAYGSAMGTSTFNGQHSLAVPVVRFSEFLKDTQRIGRGVVVLAPGWEQALENNKQAYALEFVQTVRFTSQHSPTLTPSVFVDRLNANAGNALSASERTTAINLFGSAPTSSSATVRAQVLRMIADDTELYNGEYNRAFVLAQYFGYLRRNPNDAPDPNYTGYDFWLTKLNQFNGNYINAEMVKAFLSSIEYRQRFGN